MTRARCYDDPCGIARALDRIGERWALLIVRELMFAPKRFTDLREGLPTASPNVLSQRLDELLEAGVIRRRQLEPPSRAWVYELTPWGRELDDVLLSLARWGSRAVPVPPGDLSADALLLALRTTFDPRRDEPMPLVIELRLGARRHRVTLETGRLDIGGATAEEVDTILDTDPATLRRLVFGDLALADARARGAIRIEGSQRAATRFLRSFRRPAKHAE